MGRALIFLLLLSGCGGVAWNTTLADHAEVRAAMLASVVPGSTTEKGFTARWGNPAQKFREGGQVTYVYRNMKNPPGFWLPQHGISDAYVLVAFQYGLAVGAMSSDTEGCRATFPPRPPGSGFDNPATVYAVNCGVRYDGSTEGVPVNVRIARAAEGIWTRMREGPDAAAGRGAPAAGVPGVPDDSYAGGGKYGGKYR